LELPKIDEFVKSQKSRRSREGGSPKLLDLTGFPLSREWRKRGTNDFLRDHQNSQPGKAKSEIV